MICAYIILGFIFIVSENDRVSEGFSIALDDSLKHLFIIKITLVIKYWL